MGRGSNNTGNSHFNLHVEDMPGDIRGDISIFSRLFCLCWCVGE